MWCTISLFCFFLYIFFRNIHRSIWDTCTVSSPTGNDRKREPKYKFNQYPLSNFGDENVDRRTDRHANKKYNGFRNENYNIIRQERSHPTSSVAFRMTPWSRVLLEKLTVAQPVKTFPAFYGTWRFITVFTRAHHWPVSWARCIQSTTLHPSFLRSSLILSSHLRLGLTSGLFPSDFPTKILYSFLISPVASP